MFHVLRLTSEQIRNGALFQISDALDRVFNESAKAAMAHQTSGNKEEMLILFENSTTNPNFWENQGKDAQDVLYLNEAAKDAVSAAGLKFEYSDTVENAPEQCGVMSRMYRFF